MERRQFLQAAAAVQAPGLLGQSRVSRNVLLLIADDLGLHTGAYGDKTARTPNLDKLAADGVRFTNAYCTTASCSASRSVIHSGLHNHANGQYGHAHDFHHFAYLPFVRPVSSLLKDSGYRTGVIGKMHVNPIERFRWDLNSQGEARDVVSMAERARQFIEGAGGSPWFLQIGYADPHRAEKGFANRDYKGVVAEKFDAAKVEVPPFLPDNPETRAEIAEYYEACSRLDAGIGMITDVLRATKQLDNTLVLFISDNGMPFPNAKTNLYDAGSRLPLIMRMPGETRRGSTSDQFVSWTDITPTILEWTAAKPPAYALHGRSFLGSASAPDRVYFSHTFHELTMYYPTRGVRTARYKYLLNLFPELSFPFSTDLWASDTWQSVRKAGPSGKLGLRVAETYLHRPAEELYDLSSDPFEVRNLAASSDHQAVLKQLRQDVRRFRVDTRDPWLVNDNYHQ
ncbi:MAG TPA: sulfatase [Bryobacteraceae bacterium]|nr:sulfatase [Bryobacteraceae bacterium]